MSDNVNAAQHITIESLVRKLEAFKDVWHKYQEFLVWSDLRKQREETIGDKLGHVPHDDDDLVLLKHNKEREKAAEDAYVQVRTVWEMADLKRNAPSAKLAKERKGRAYECKKDHSQPSKKDAPNPKEVRRIMKEAFAKVHGLEPSACQGYVNCTLCHRLTGQPLMDSVKKHCQGDSHKQALKDEVRHNQLHEQHQNALAAGPEAADDTVLYHELWEDPRIPTDLMSHITPTENRINVQFRAQMYRAFLKGGASTNLFNAINGTLTRWIIQECTTTSPQHMAMDYTGPLLAHERLMLKSEINGEGGRGCQQMVWLIFDGATRVCEVMCVIVRFVDANYIVQQRLIRLKLYEGSFDGEELLTAISDILVGAGIMFRCVTGTMTDMCAVNIKAMKALRDKYHASNLLIAGCNSHTFDGVGGKADVPVLQSFWNVFINLTALSTYAKSAWVEAFGETLLGYSSTRWWSQWECKKQLCKEWHRLGDWIDILEREGIGEKTTPKLRLSDVV
jgi:hypothetical protein